MVWLRSTSATSHAFEEPLGTVYPIEDLPQDLAVAAHAPARRGAARRPALAP